MSRLLLLLSIASTALLGHTCAQETVTFYPSYGYPAEDGQSWRVPIRARVLSRTHRHDLAANSIQVLLHGYLRYPSAESNNVDARTRAFTMHSEPVENLKIAFKALPGKKFPIDAEGMIKVMTDDAKKLWAVDEGKDVWLDYEAVSDGHRGGGRVRMLAAKGFSVISDIDDTIKVTEIPAGKKIVLRNTFCRDFKAAETMQPRYHAWEQSGHSFHYVSAGPWRLFAPLEAFRSEAKFPEGSFAMRDVDFTPSSLRDWEALHDLIFDKEAAYKYKVDRISKIIKPFINMERKFILVGDSGEKDPEVYETIRKRFPGKIENVIIRTVSPFSPKENVEIVKGRVAKKDQSQFD